MEKQSTPADQTHGDEIKKTHEMYEKGMPAPGTRDAGKNGADFQPQDEPVKNNDQPRADKQT